jgi:hypothetical protein
MSRLYAPVAAVRAGYAEALADHRRVLRNAFVSEAGMEVDTQGRCLLRRFPHRYWGSRLGGGRAAGARVGTDRGPDGPAYGNPDGGR